MHQTLLQRRFHQVGTSSLHKNKTKTGFGLFRCSLEPRKKPSYFPLYWLVDKDPCNCLSESPHNPERTRVFVTAHLVYLVACPVLTCCIPQNSHRCPHSKVFTTLPLCMPTSKLLLQGPQQLLSCSVFPDLFRKVLDVGVVFRFSFEKVSSIPKSERFSSQNQSGKQYLICKSSC